MALEIGFLNMLSLAQTIGIVGTLVLTLYFSKKQIQNLSTDTKTQLTYPQMSMYGKDFWHIWIKKW